MTEKLFTGTLRIKSNKKDIFIAFIAVNCHGILENFVEYSLDFIHGFFLSVYHGISREGLSGHKSNGNVIIQTRKIREFMYCLYTEEGKCQRNTNYFPHLKTVQYINIELHNYLILQNFVCHHDSFKL